MAYDLDFERPLAELEKRMQPFERRGDKLKADERAKLDQLKRDLEQQTQDIYSSLTPWQRVQVARHRDRPYAGDYIKLMCEDFFELRGDRRYGDDRALIGGVASLDGQTIMILGSQKGRDTKERVEVNFGMAHPEGYRKALRLFRQAERFKMPVVTLVDISGASLGLEDEQRGISEAIAENLLVMSSLRTPILTIIIGEGGSGGALGISVADRILMMEHAIFYVASPEAAASILWRDAAFAANAAESMKITAPDLLKMGLIEAIIPEPLGGAHRDHRAVASTVKEAMLKHLDELREFQTDELLERRYQRYRAIGNVALEPVGVGVKS
ncbi:MAG TPA: acetyl-CoA carboxylase carboxyltransferase subunit alpha [Ktedonobacterales bacterium]|jgi:acetyl-CoA carboxylase carboxyl transferase subunit alpha|nr:acetyl-CoA carboxylase carboxyltransferase subunit alpha [Ktedonobacterales bacterium]